MIKGKEKKDDFKLWLGLHDVDVIAFNPDYETLKEYFGGSDKTKEPIYTFEENGLHKLRLDIWIQDTENNIRCKDALFLEDRLVPESGNKNFLWVNDVGQSIWMGEDMILSEERQKYFDLNRNPRRAYVGEAQLLDFLVNWAGIDQKAEDSVIVLDTPWEEIVRGDVYELNKYISIINRKVRVALTVVQGKYQGFYAGKVLRAKSEGSRGGTYVEGIRKDLEKKSNIEFDVSKVGLIEYTGTGISAPDVTVKQASPEEIKAALNI